MQTMHTPREGEIPHVPQAQIPAPPRPGASAPGTPTGEQSRYATASERYGGGMGGGTGASREGGPLGSLHISGSSTTYTILGLLLLLGGILGLVMPYRLTDIFFKGEREYYDVLFEELWRILAATLFAAAATAYALKIASDRRTLADPVVQRLQLGLTWFALLAIIIHLVHLFFVKSLTFWGLLLGALIMAPTLLLPGVHLGMSGGFGLMAAADSVTSAFANVFAPRRVTLTVLCYSLLTVLFTLAGLSYLILPKLSLKWVFGVHHASKRSVFLWQWIGAGMVFLFPSITYTCLERGIEGLLWRTVPKVLNVGLLVAALFHILEFGSMWASEGIAGRWMLPVLLVHWVLALLTSVLGLSAGGEPAGPAYEYETLPAAAV